MTAEISKLIKKRDRDRVFKKRAKTRKNFEQSKQTVKI
jgi:hypothetical protein